MLKITEKDNDELRVKTTYSYNSKVIIQNGEDIHYNSSIFLEILIKRGILK